MGESKIPKSTANRLLNDVILDEEETFVRADVALVYGNQLASPRLALMIVTTKRILFCPPLTSRRYPLRSWLGIVGPGNKAGAPNRTYRVKTRPPMSKSMEILLTNITRLWKWRPEFSSAPMIQASHGGVSYWLMVDESPWRSVASDEALREHFDLMQLTWRAAVDR